MLEQEEEQLEELQVDDESEVAVAEVSPEELSNIIKRKDRLSLREVFDKVPNIDIAEASEELDPQELIYIFRTMPSEYTADYFDELSQKTKESLLNALTDKELVKLINEQYADDVADTLVELPANLANRVLKAASKDMREDLNELLRYAKDTAGAIMTTEYLEFPDTIKVKDAIDGIRKRGKDAETVYTVFVRNSKREFVGTVDLDDLIFAKEDEPLKDIMNQDVVSVMTTTDKEDVGKAFRRYDLNALAVLNADSRLVGVITIDDAVDVITEESAEDIARLTNMEPMSKPYMETSAWGNAKKCIPWLIGLMILGTFTTMILDRLQSQKIFTTMTILTAFVPVLMDTGGNAGGQTTGMMIRGLAVEEFGPRDVLKILWKEFKSALIVASIFACFAFLWILMEQYTGIVNLGNLGEGNNYDGATIWNGQCWTLGFFQHAMLFAGLVAVTLFSAILAAKIIGALLPIGAAALKKDPALLSQPLLTTIMDAASLLIYYGVACAFFPMYA